MRPSTFRKVAWPRASNSISRSNNSTTRCRWYSQKLESDDPLKILFCGTDDFSKESLKALNVYSKTPESNVLSIDVVTRTDKRVGRGRKQFRSPPIKHAAQELGLPLHQIDTFTGWRPPLSDNKPCNLIIAVSFGLLVPPRILGGAKYGGLNVHPSMLPDLRGPAPIPWAINLGRRTTGISIQTLHPSRFDEGLILSQTSTPGLEIPDPDTITSPELEAYLAPVGAKMLVDAIKNRLYIPPHKPVQSSQGTSTKDLVHAPKIKKDFHAIDFTTMTATEILRRNRAIGKLHAFGISGNGLSEMRQILLDQSMRPVNDQDIPESVRNVTESIPDGIPFAIVPTNENIKQGSQPLIINVKDNDNGGRRQVLVPQILVASMAKNTAARAAASAIFFSVPERLGSYNLYRFSHPLSMQTTSG